jgi:hypothetical protein
MVIVMTKAELVEVLVNDTLDHRVYPSATREQREKYRHRDYWELHDYFCKWSRKKLLSVVFHNTLNKLGGL